MATCTVSGTLLNPSEVAISGATVRFNIEGPALDNGGPSLLGPTEVTTTTASDGTWSLALAQNCSGILTIEIPPDAVNSAVRYTFSLVIPSTSTALFSACWADSANVAGATSPLTFSLISGTLLPAQMVALTGDVTNSTGSTATTLSAIHGVTVAGVTGTGSVVLSASPTFTGNVGIGQTAPGTNGAPNAMNLVIGDSTVTANTGITLLTNSGGAPGSSRIVFSRSNASAIGGSIIYDHSGGENFAFLVSNTEKMRLNGTGLGIGMTPTNVLDVAGTFGATGAVTLGSTVNVTGTITGPGSGISALNASNLASGTVPAARLPNPAATTLGGVKSLAAASHNFLTQIGTDGSVSQAQPAFSDLSGSATGAQLPNPSSSTLGGVQSAAAVSHQWINSISTSGVPALSQPAFSDISGSVAAAQLPNPAATTLGGVKSLAAVTHQFLTQIGTDGSVSQAQPAFTDISGSVAAAQLPNPAATTLGGVKSLASVSHNFLTQIGTDGSVSQAQPAFTDISGSVAAAQLPNPSSSTLGGVQSAASVSHQWINSISTSGVPALSQPAFSDLSGSATDGQLPSSMATKTFTGQTTIGDILQSSGSVTSVAYRNVDSQTPTANVSNTGAPTATALAIALPGGSGSYKATVYCSTIGHYADVYLGDGGGNGVVIATQGNAGFFTTTANNANTVNLTFVYATGTLSIQNNTATANLRFKIDVVRFDH